MKKFIDVIPREYLSHSGEVFYSGGEAFSGEKDIYILGFNPGSSPLDPSLNTLQKNIDVYTASHHLLHSSYIDDDWQRGTGVGESRMQRGLKHVAHRVGFDLRHTPSSNLIFLRSESVAELPLTAGRAVDLFWPFHIKVIECLRIRVIVAMGHVAGKQIIRKLSGKLLRTEFEKNNRGWRMEAFRSPSGVIVVSLPHPTRSMWYTPPCDPSEFILWALEQQA